ncbi:MAG: MerR family transcriptional regulator [Clostridiaceae bacterium]|nr:MerR family transcriptional regulator [Clostridiaceae bacterium]
MEYTVKALAKLSGVSCRAIRFYDEKNLLKPKRISPSGYRIYGEEEVKKLQEILFYKDMGFSISQIKKIIENTKTDIIKMLKEHRENLEKEKIRIDELIKNLNATIREKEEGIKMENQERFMGFKKRMIEENEREFGKEIHEKYGDEAVERANQKIMDMTEEDFEKLNNIEKQLFIALGAALSKKNPRGEHAQQAARLHKDWLSIQWGGYDSKKHYYLTQMYLQDERFKNYYDTRVGEGATALLAEAVKIYTGMDEENNLSN